MEIKENIRIFEYDETNIYLSRERLDNSKTISVNFICCEQ
jgi:hypothetical protein